MLSKRKIGVWLILLYALSNPVIVYALEEYEGFWNKNFINVHSKENPYLFQLELEERFKGGLEKVSARPALGYQVNNVSFWLGYAYFETYPFKPSLRRGEYRIWQQCLGPEVKKKCFTFFPRLRLESRKRNDSHQWNEVAREQLNLTLHTTSTIGSDIVIYNEIFCNLHTPDWDNTRFIKENRFYLGIQKKLTKHFQIGVGYLNRYESNRENPNMGHILLVTLTFDVSYTSQEYPN